MKRFLWVILGSVLAGSGILLAQSHDELPRPTLSLEFVRDADSPPSRPTLSLVIVPDEPRADATVQAGVSSCANASCANAPCAGATWGGATWNPTGAFACRTDCPPVPRCAVDCLASGKQTTDGGRWWVSGEYLVWWLSKGSTPPLVTTFPLAPGNPADEAFKGLSAGAFGRPETQLVLGGTSGGSDQSSGGRISAGYWLVPEQTVGIAGDYMFTVRRTSTQSVSTTGQPGSNYLTVPFFDIAGTTTGGSGGNVAGLPGESVGPLSAPGFLRQPFAGFADVSGPVPGTFTLVTTSQLQGAELNGFANLLRGANGLRVDLLGGARWVQLNEELTFSSASVDIQPFAGGGPIAGLVFNAQDQFRTLNDFYGGQLGIRAEYPLDRFFVRATGKLALGDMHQSVAISGVTQTQDVGFYRFGLGFVNAPMQAIPGGIFAQPSNMGSHTRDAFAVVPEATINLGYKVTRWARVLVGYNVLYLSSVARPGDQMDRVINPTRTAFAASFNANSPNLAIPVVGPANPAFTFNESSFWAQGVNVGLEVTY